MMRTEEERDAFRSIAFDYRAAAEFRTGRAYIHGLILAELVLLGWRRSAQAEVDRREPPTTG